MLFFYKPGNCFSWQRTLRRTLVLLVLYSAKKQLSILCTSEHQISTSEVQINTSGHRLSTSEHQISTSEVQISTSGHRISTSEVLISTLEVLK